MDIDITIIGAGVIGLAIASELSSKYSNVFIIEKNERIGQETSSRNSEVIHAGIYYPKDSQKAKMCVAGNKRLYQYCRERRVPFNPCGKYIVATNPDEEAQLEVIRQKALDNGVTSLELVTSQQIQKAEPLVKATAGLWSPDTGVINSHRYMVSLLAAAQKNRAQLFLKTEVIGIEKAGSDQYLVQVRYPDGETDQFETRCVINCAGLYADRVAALMGIDIDVCGYRQHFWKGEYFSLDADAFDLKHLIYPVPLPQNVGLGIHTTIDVKGGVKLGPNAIYLENSEFDYTVSSDSKEAFFTAAAKYLPTLALDHIQPQMAGIRPKLQKPGDPAQDFIINEESDKGLPGVVNLLGIESPGLTSSLAIAKTVANLLS